MTPTDIRRLLEQPLAHGQTLDGDGQAEDRRRAHQALGRTLRPAAVLVLLAERSTGLSLVLTQRSADLADHAGQISLPGGRLDSTDADAVAAALREAQEEIAAEPQAITVLGRLPSYVTVTAYDITPIVATTTQAAWRPDPQEVADVFEVPLQHILAESSWRRDRMLLAGQTREYWAVPWRERYIWGATAGMLRNLRASLLR